MPRLIPDARHAWRFGSVQVATLLALLSAMQAEVLPLVQPLFPLDVWPWVSGALALAVVLLRLVAQPAVERQRQQDAAREAEIDRLHAEMLECGESFDYDPRDFL